MGWPRKALGALRGGMLFWGARAHSDLDLTCPRSWMRPSRCLGLDWHAPSSWQHLQSGLLGRLCSARCRSRPPCLPALLPQSWPCSVCCFWFTLLPFPPLLHLHFVTLVLPGFSFYLLFPLSPLFIKGVSNALLGSRAEDDSKSG